jgi:RNA-binding protein
VDVFADLFMITNHQKRFLKARAHHLKPVVMTGNAGLTDAVLNEIDIALEHHELIKVRVNAGDRDERERMIAQICDSSHADLVQNIGHIAILFRRAQKPVLVLPKA